MEGSLAGAWTLDSDLQENSMKWDEMPELFGLDFVFRWCGSALP